MLSAIRILTPTEWSNTKKGNYFEDLISSLFRRMQYNIRERIRVTGMEIDLLGEQIHTKENAFIECKFYSNLFESQIISKLIGNAVTTNDIDIAYLVSTSEPGKDAAGKLLEIEKSDNRIRGGLRFAFVGPQKLIKLFLNVNNLPDFNTRISRFSNEFQQSICACTLVIAPEESFWVIEQSRGGIPERAYVISTNINHNSVDNFATIKKLMDANKLWIDTELVDGLPDLIQATGSSLDISPSEVITQVSMADKFDDYAPSRPENFVGRSSLLKQIINHLRHIREEQPRRRVIALSGPSGFGKSSVILKLADQCSKHGLKNQIRIYHVDCRSATRPIFVIEAIRTALQSAIDSHFVKGINSPIQINTVEDPFAAASVQNLLQSLSEQKKLLVIVFDQFEELLVKEQLLSAFESIKKVAFAVEALQANLLLGFSWRTSIALGESHPAYHMWHALQDKRAEFRIGLFEDRESLEMLVNLEANLGYKLDDSLRRHLLEQAQGIPWLLKKFCVHVYRCLLNGVSQRDLLETQLDSASLFREEIDNLSPTQVSCLRYIAQNAPIDLTDVHDKFSQDTPDFLYNNRLIIRSGYKYSIYWDVFREYLISGKVPPIPMTYVPQVQLTTALTALRFVLEREYISITDIQNTFGYAYKTSLNIINDLSALFFIDRQNTDQIVVVNELWESSKVKPFESAVSTYAAEQLRRHIVLQRFYEILRPGEEMAYSRSRDIFAEAYPSWKTKTLNAYVNRLMPWFRFAGLLEINNPDRVARPMSEGREKGRAVIKQARLVDGHTSFLCSSGPQNAIYLAVLLIRNKSLKRDVVVSFSQRNAAQDLVALKLATWREGYLYPTGELLSLSDQDDAMIYNACSKVVKYVALNSRFLKAITREISRNYSVTDTEIANSVAKEFGREWQPSSAQRYIGAGKRWLDHFDKITELVGQKKLFNDEDLDM